MQFMSSNDFRRTFVNQHSDSDQSAFPPEKDDNANYLRRLRDGPTSVPGAKNKTPGSAAQGAAYPAPRPAPALRERRKTPRYVCSGRVELIAEGTEVRLWGTLTDISLHGCYVEMDSTFPVGTNLDLAIESIGIRIKTAAVVRANYPSLGMGISFGAIDAQQTAKLQELLVSLAGRKA
jgi:hypothetical protein